MHQIAVIAIIAAAAAASLVAKIITTKLTVDIRKHMPSL